MASYIGAGKLNKPAQVLELRETSQNVWEWVPVRRAWAQIEFQAKTNLFSSVGIGARDAAMVIRRQSLGLHNAMSWGGHHLFLTSITDHGRGHLDVDAAVVQCAKCAAARYEARKGAGNRPERTQVMQATFPAVLTEKYVRYGQEKTYSEVKTCYVLVTPKQIALRVGDLVEVKDGPAAGSYHILTPHVLDAYKNEYEIVREADA